jgi:SAM-dependent methyltransferase
VGRATVPIPVYLPEFAHDRLRRLRARRARAPAGPRAVTLAGDRHVEWSWVAAQLPDGSGTALDFGARGSSLALVAAQRGLDVTAIDLKPARWHFEHPRIRFVHGDLLDLELDAGSFDVVLNCSTVEHVGLAGRYGVTRELSDGDLAAMGRLRELMRPGGVMLLTIPVGKDAVAAPLHRVYGEQRLPRLLEGLAVERQEFWVKAGDDRWQIRDRDRALAFAAPDPRTMYALGCFVLRKGDAASA